MFPLVFLSSFCVKVPSGSNVESLHFLKVERINKSSRFFVRQNTAAKHRKSMFKLFIFSVYYKNGLKDSTYCKLRTQSTKSYDFVVKKSCAYAYYSFTCMETVSLGIVDTISYIQGYSR